MPPSLIIMIFVGVLVAAGATIALLSLLGPPALAIALVVFGIAAVAVRRLQ